MKTTLYAVLCVAIRLGAVLMAVPVLVALLFYFLGTSDREFTMMELGFAGLYLLIAAVLWFWPGVLARCAVRNGDDVQLVSGIDADGLQRIAFATLGAWFLIEGLAGAVAAMAALWQLHVMRGHYPGMQLPTGQWDGLIRAVVSLVAGAALMFGSRGLVILLQRLRGSAHIESVSPDDDAATTPRG